MKFLVATKATQGQRKNDFCQANEGEVLRFGSECDREDVDGKCGCKRAFSGIGTHKGTTTMLVKEAEEFDQKTATNRFAESLCNAGWFKNWGDAFPEAKKQIEAMQKMLVKFEAGEIVERRGDFIQTRSKRASINS